MKIFESSLWIRNCLTPHLISQLGQWDCHRQCRSCTDTRPRKGQNVERDISLTTKQPAVFSLGWKIRRNTLESEYTIEMHCEILKTSWCLLRNKLPAMSLPFNYVVPELLFHWTEHTVSNSQAGFMWWLWQYEYWFIKQNPLPPVLCAAVQIKSNLVYFQFATDEDLKTKNQSLTKLHKKYNFTKVSQEAGREWVYNE